MVRRMAVVGLLLAGLCAGCCPMRTWCCGPGSGNPHLGKVRHVVLFKFKDTAKPQEVKAIEAGFQALAGKIPQVRDLEWGTDMSPEGLAEGFSHCFLVTFDDAKARDAYLPHPAHQAFVAQLKPILDKVLVIDYIAKR